MYGTLAPFLSLVRCPRSPPPLPLSLFFSYFLSSIKWFTSLVVFSSVGQKKRNFVAPKVFSSSLHFPLSHPSIAIFLWDDVTFTDRLAEYWTPLVCLAILKHFPFFSTDKRVKNRGIEEKEGAQQGIPFPFSFPSSLSVDYLVVDVLYVPCCRYLRMNKIRRHLLLCTLPLSHTWGKQVAPLPSTS